MRGVGRASSAVTIVNAVPGGRGAAAAIDLGCQVTAELVRVTAGELPTLRIEPEESPLLRAAVGVALRAYAPIENHHVRLVVDSDIPVARGFKSSSAVTVAAFEAIAAARGQRPSGEELARKSAELALHMKLSATGAFNDALAAAEGGVVLTDNVRNVVVGRGEIEDDLQCVLHVPPTAHAPSPQLAARFAEFRDDALRAFADAQAGRYFDAMGRNSRLVEAAMGYRLGGLRSALIAAGARLLTVSGMGPGLVAFAPPAAVEPVRARLAQEPGAVRVVALRRAGRPARLAGESAGDR